MDKLFSGDTRSEIQPGLGHRSGGAVGASERGRGTILILSWEHFLNVMALNNENAVAQQIHSLLRQPGDVRWQPRLVNNGGQHPCCFDPE